MCRKIAITENNKIFVMFSKSSYDPKNVEERFLHPSHLVSLKTYNYIPDVTWDRDIQNDVESVVFESHGSVINRHDVIIKPHTKIILSSNGHMQVIKESSTLFVLRSKVKEVKMKYVEKLSTYRMLNFLSNLPSYEHGMLTKIGYKEGPISALRTMASSTPIVENDVFDDIHEIYYDKNQTLQIKLHKTYIAE